MLVKNLNQYSDSILEFLESLKKQDSKYSYNISSSENLTSTGAKLELGFTCYALKLRHMFNDQSLDDNNIFEWFNYISSFQKNIQGFPSNSFVDDSFLLNDVIARNDGLTGSIPSEIGNLHQLQKLGDN